MDGMNLPPAERPDSSEVLVLESLPREFGVLLVVAGVGGVLLPGPVGTPLLVLGGLILFPKLFRKVDQGLARRFPKLHREGMRQARRLVTDLESRYPTRS
jgi:hypothetical protein